MDSVDSLNKPEASAHGSTSPPGASNSTASGTYKQLKVVVWCARRVKFCRPCTSEFSTLPECACIPMVRYLNAGQTDRIRP